MQPPYSRGLLRLKRTRRSPLRSQSHFAFIYAAAPATKRLVIVGFGAPVELDGNASYKGVRRFPELFPFLGFREPVFHFSFRNRSPLAAHAFLRSKIICCPHDASPIDRPITLPAERGSWLDNINQRSRLRYPQLYSFSCDRVTTYLARNYFGLLS